MSIPENTCAGIKETCQSMWVQASGPFSAQQETQEKVLLTTRTTAPSISASIQFVQMFSAKHIKLQGLMTEIKDGKVETH